MAATGLDVFDKTMQNTNTWLRETRANSATACAVRRRRVPEVRENSVSHVLGDKAPVFLDQFCAAAVIRADNRPQVLGINSG